MKSRVTVLTQLFSVGLLLLGCRKEGAGYRNTLQGTWVLDRVKADGTSFHSTTTVAADGSYVCSMMEHSPLDSSNVYSSDSTEGTYQLKDGYLYDTLTKSLSTNFHGPSVFRARLIRFDSHELVVTDEVNSVQAVFRRQK